MSRASSFPWHDGTVEDETVDPLTPASHFPYRLLGHTHDGKRIALTSHKDMEVAVIAARRASRDTQRFNRVEIVNIDSRVEPMYKPVFRAGELID